MRMARRSFVLHGPFALYGLILALRTLAAKAAVPADEPGPLVQHTSGVKGTDGNQGPCGGIGVYDHTHSLIGAAEGPFEYHKTATFPNLSDSGRLLVSSRVLVWRDDGGGWMHLPMAGDNLKVSDGHYAETPRNEG